MSFLATALKCIVGTGPTKTSMDCTSGLDVCVNETSSIISITAYKCDAASTYPNLEKKCTTANSITTCLCDTDDCNSPPPPLKCYQGNTNSTGALTTTTACASTMDRCSKATKDGQTVWTCTLAALMTASGFTDEACSTVDSVQYCLCKTDGCNSAPTQTATQAITLFAFVSMMKLAIS